MCGITGWFSNHKNLDKDVFKIATDALTHRGPEASGCFLINRIP